MHTCTQYIRAHFWLYISKVSNGPALLMIPDPVQAYTLFERDGFNGVLKVISRTHYKYLLQIIICCHFSSKPTRGKSQKTIMTKVGNIKGG